MRSMTSSGTMGSLVHAMSRAGRRDALIVVPPFVDINRPSLGVHLLQAEARRAGFDVSILYANMLFAEQIGIEEYRAIGCETTRELIGETCFRAAAFGSAENPQSLIVDEAEFELFRELFDLDFATFSRINRLAASWCDELCSAIAECAFPVVGCTTTFEQTCASLAILKRVKAQNPATTTILGGANCEGEMADGVLSIGAGVDFVFSGESETAFVSFLRTRSSAAGIAASGTIIHGSPNQKLDELAPPSYREYFEQLALILPDIDPQTTWVPYESSRGCWWGEKHHCTFCGLNGEGMGFREKSPATVIRDLSEIAKTYDSRNVLMVDNIMPHSYFNSLLPRAVDELPELCIFYEQKSNLNLTKMELLRGAGIHFIQPGIEALSTPLLKLMKKGVKASQNIALLRYARALEVAVFWNFIGEFPGDRAEWYRNTIRIMSVIKHLTPPRGVFSLRIHRFSPYFKDPAGFGVRNIRAVSAYGRIFPPGSDIERIAYHFDSDFESGFKSDDSIYRDMTGALADWKRRWKTGIAPQLHVSKIADDLYILRDTREIEGAPEVEFIDEEQARVCLWGPQKTEDSSAIEWALQRSACLTIDGEVVPLATADTKLMHRLEAGGRTGQHSVAPAREAIATA
jgi:ribosomal peptide maturation radical SAM protein 1